MSHVLKNGDVSRKPLLIGVLLLLLFMLAFILIAPDSKDKENHTLGETSEPMTEGYERKLEKSLLSLKKDEKKESNAKEKADSSVFKASEAAISSDSSPKISYQKEALPDEDFIKDYVIFQEQEGLDEPLLNTRREHKESNEKNYNETLYDDLNLEPEEVTLPASEDNKIQTLKDKRNEARLALKKQREEAFLRALGASSSVNVKPSIDTSRKMRETSAEADKKIKDVAYSSEDEDNSQYTLKRYESLAMTDTVLNNEVVSPKTPYALMQGTIIQAVLLNGISSELPGQVSAMLTKDVYDSIRGRHLLLPRGSKLIGQYDSHLAVGAERLFLGFTRIIFPNGDSLNLGVMPGQSQDGMAGFDANVNNHYLKTIFSCLMLSSISTAGDTIETHTYENGTETVVSRQGRELNQNLSNSLSNIISRNLNLAPTLKIEPGYRFSIAMTKDIFFRAPYGRSQQGYLIP